LPDEIIVQADIDRSFWRCPIISHGGLYVHIMRTFMPRLAHFGKGFTQQKFGNRKRWLAKFEQRDKWKSA